MSTITPIEDLIAIEKVREEELEEARIIQSSMLPTQPLQAGAVVVSHEFQPMAEVGGDYLDYFPLPDGNVGLYVGDVSGKGLPAALYAAMAVGTLRGIHKTGLAPSQVVALLNERLCLRGVPRRYSALQYAVFYPPTAEIRIASAGMPGPVLIRDGKCDTLLIPGIPPGLLPQVTYDEVCLRLKPGDTLLFCTDGLTEARNHMDVEFGVEGVTDVCRSHASAKPLDLLEEVFSALEIFTGECRQSDDMTAAVFHYCPR